MISPFNQGVVFLFLNTRYLLDETESNSFYPKDILIQFLARTITIISNLLKICIFTIPGGLKSNQLLHVLLYHIYYYREFTIIIKYLTFAVFVCLMLFVFY